MTLTQEVYTRLRTDILSLTFAENEFLNEAELAKRYSVSKAPIREALHRLCMEGVLVSWPRKGYLLAPVSQRDYEHTQRLRLLCEGYAIELAAQADAAAKDALVEMSGKPYKIEENAAFHRAIAEMSGVKTLTATVSLLLSTIERTISLRNQSAGIGTQAGDVHRRMAKAIQRGDAQAAKEALAEDLRLAEG